MEFYFMYELILDDDWLMTGLNLELKNNYIKINYICLLQWQISNKLQQGEKQTTPPLLPPTGLEGVLQC